MPAEGWISGRIYLAKPKLCKEEGRKTRQLCCGVRSSKYYTPGAPGGNFLEYQGFPLCSSGFSGWLDPLVGDQAKRY
jgi:hypothetical protein